LLNAGTSVRQYGSIKESIDAALRGSAPPDGKPTLVVENVEFEGRQVKQLLLGNGDYVLLEPDTLNPIAVKEGGTFTRYTGSPKVDVVTHTAGTPDATIERTYTTLDGAAVTARVREEISAGGVSRVTIQDAEGHSYTVTPNSFSHVRLNADGSIKDGIFRNEASGTIVRFRNSQMVPSRVAFNAITGQSASSQDNPGELVTIEYEVPKQSQGDAGQQPLEEKVAYGDALLVFIKQALPPGLGDVFGLHPSAEAQQAVHNWTNGWGFKTDLQIAREKTSLIQTTHQFGQTGDVLLVGGDDPVGGFIRAGSGGGPVNHTAYLERAGDGTLWVIDINPRSLSGKNDLRRTPFDEWQAEYKFVEIVRQNDPAGGQQAVQHIHNVYVLRADGRTFEKGPAYNLLGAILGGLPLVGGLFRNDPNHKFCSELVCDTQLAIQRPLPGLPQNSWRTPNDLFWTVRRWGRDLREVAPPTQATESAP